MSSATAAPRPAASSPPSLCRNCPDWCAAIIPSGDRWAAIDGMLDDLDRSGSATRQARRTFNAPPDHI